MQYLKLPEVINDVEGGFVGKGEVIEPHGGRTQETGERGEKHRA